MSEQPKFDQLSPRTEQQPRVSELSEKDLEELKESIREMSKELRDNEKMPIDSRGRIDMGQFGGKDYKDVERDRERVRGAKEAWRQEAVAKAEQRCGAASNREQILKMVDEKMKIGEVWEMFSTAILHKHLRKRLGKDFMVVRTSEYDDFCNKMGKVDNLILDKKTGNVICAFDEVVSLFGEETDTRVAEKIENIKNKNLQKGGADIRYGIYFEEKAGEMRLKKGPISHLPIFYLAISAEDLKKAIGNPAEQEKVFQQMIDSMNKQIQAIKEEPLNDKLRARLDFFEKVFQSC